MMSLEIGTPVEFALPDKVVSGHLYKKGTRRNRAQVIDDSDMIWRVPEHFLKVKPGPNRNTIITSVDLERSKYRVGDLVSFSIHGEHYSGKIHKLNPIRAIVILSNGDQWTVSYFSLKLVSTPSTSRQGTGRLNEISSQARNLMDSHGLHEWNLRFDESTRFLGKCNYRDRSIHLSRSHALDGKDSEIRDTILHEIAHALAGPKARHGTKWKMIAQQIGAKPRASFKPDA
ncbi:MAG: SprT-like domain-containing protein [Rhodobacteraceae bacterium]|nr:SprT-like domain-containing protein [Paracoccaceae bacterium]MCY4248980.1 SprT-like domain-containing protein [Paracoccaceae bacterium]